MISAIKNHSYITTRPAAQPVAVEPDPPEDPRDELDPIGLGQINTVEKAMQLPIMDPAFQATLAMGIAGRALGAAFGVPINVSIRGSAASDQTAPSISQVSLGPNHSSHGGLVAGNYFVAGGLEVDAEAGTARWTSRFANTNVDLTFTMDQENEQLVMEGHLGSVPARLVYTGEATEDGGAVLHADGQLGGKAYAVDTKLDEIPDTDSGVDVFNIVSRGTVGDLSVDKTYTGTVSADTDNMSGTLEIRGEGQNAGHQQQVEIQATVSQAQ